MSKAWFAIPSARPAAEVQPVVDRWREMGYKVALCRDEGCFDVDADHLTSMLPYPGYAVAVNSLAKQILSLDKNCMFVITGGDDTLPDPNKRADEIALECELHFAKAHYGDPQRPDFCTGYRMETFGVMQPTGDRFASGSIDRIAGSPWMGREFCERMYGGNGPLYHGYQHMHVDEELFCVANLLGVYWPRRDLVHFHNHFMRASEDLNSPATRTEVPPHLLKWNTAEHWDSSKALFLGRKAAGFPGHQPLPVEVLT